MYIQKAIIYSLLAFTLFHTSCISAAQLIYEGRVSSHDLLFKDMVKPNGIKSRPSNQNPLISGKNLYAPEIVKMNNKWNVYYGGWKTVYQTHDTIYLGITDDIAFEGPILNNSAVISPGEYIHVNDPSVQRKSSNNWVMAYTTAKYVGSDYRDWINISTSYNGTNWYPSSANYSTEISVDASQFLQGGEQLTDIARPSLLWDNNHWKLWFDGRINNGNTESYLAVSYDSYPSNFSVIHKYTSIGGFPGFYEADVKKTNEGYVAAVQRYFTGIYKYKSTDGIHFTEMGKMISNSDTGRSLISTPGLIYDDSNGTTYGIAFGMTNNSSLIDHDIGFAYSQYTAKAVSCPNVWHQYQDAVYYETVKLKTFQYSSICRIQILDSDTNAILIDKSVSSYDGDQWRFVP